MNQPSEIKEIVWDADNTLWDWVSYAVPAYEAMAQYIADKMKIPEPKVAKEMKRFYTAMGTMEHVYLIQGLESMGFFKQHPNINTEELAIEAQQIFSNVRKKHLNLYSGITETFKITMENGIRNTILTDAPGLQAPMRLKHFGLYSEDPKKMRAFALKATKPKKLPQKFMDKQKRGKYLVPFQLQYIDEEKPNTNLKDILKMTRDEISRHVIIIGDNQKKDMKLAKNWKCRGLYAKYGEARPDLLKRLLRFAPTTIAKRNVSIETDTNKPEKDNDLISIIESPHEILPQIGLAA